MSPHCTTLGYAALEHSSFSVMWPRQLSVFPEGHCEQTLNPPFVGSGPTAGLCSNTQICEAGRMKLGESNCKNHSSGTYSLLHLSRVSPIAFYSQESNIFPHPALLDTMWLPAPVAGVLTSKGWFAFG